MCRRVSDTAAGEQSGIACTDAERRAALALAQELRDQGREPRVQTLWVHVAWWAPQALAAALGVAASVVGVGTPVAGLSLAGAALLIALLDLLPAAPLRRVIPVRATQNVVSAPPDGADLPVTLILTAAVDRARGGLVRRFPGGVLRWSLAALVLVLACCVVRVARDRGRLGRRRPAPADARAARLPARVAGPGGRRARRAGRSRRRRRGAHARGGARRGAARATSASRSCSRAPAAPSPPVCGPGCAAAGSAA